MNIRKSNLTPNNVAFSGHKRVLNESGFEKHKFYYLYDPTKYSCEVELYNIEKDEKGNYKIAEEAPAETLPMVDGGISQDMSELYSIYSEDGFAYRFKLTDKNTGDVSYAFDNGSVIGIFDTENTDNKYNVVLNNRAIINKNGPMQLIMPDEYYPGVEMKDGKPTINEGLRAKALASVRTHANKLGGNFAGIIQRLPQIKAEGISRIVGTPFTKDTISSHKYWTENAYQVSPDLGTEEDFKTMQQELFKAGINWISDAALVNEGFGGIHLAELLRKGSDSVSKNMFRAEERLSLGILPNESQNTRMKVINAPVIITEDNVVERNKNYNPSKPTYIQFYDKRLTSKEQIDSDSPLRGTTYDKKNTDNIYDITKHDDAVYPFPIEVDPAELERNIRNAVKSGSKVDLKNIKGTDTIKKIADFSTFNVVTKSEAAGLEVWDGNVDIAKLNFYRSAKDETRFINMPYEQRQEAIADFDRGALAVRDYAINSGKYWTKLAADAQLEYVSTALASNSKTADDYMSVIKKLKRNDMMPESVEENVNEKIINNVLRGNYHLRRLYEADMRADINPEKLGSKYTLSDYILRQAMDVPLETLPVATNLLGILTSPYIAKKANTDEELGVSRYDLMKAKNPNLPAKYRKVYNQAENLYSEEIAKIIKAVVKDIPDIEENGQVSEYGKYVISEITPELTKYIFVKALNPNAKISFNEENYHIDFSDVNSEDITMQSLGIPYSGKTSEEEAQSVINILKSRIKSMNPSDFSDVKSLVERRFAQRSLNDFKVAEMIMDRTESGLGWRIDAAKDIAAIDAVRSDSDSMEKTWQNVIDFWKKYNETVLSVNPHAYTTAEITDLDMLVPNNPDAMYTSAADAERKFIQETGITAVANYNYFFSLLPDLYAPLRLEDFDDNNGWQASQEKNFKLLGKMDTGWGENPGFLFQSPEDGVTNSYTFVGNHDKPRIMHLLSLDAALYKSDFSSDEHKLAASKVLNKPVSSINFDKLSSKAVAMGSRLYDAFDSVVSDNNLKKEIYKAIAELTSGQFKGATFDSEAFGTRPLNIAIRSVLQQAEYNGVTIPNMKELEAKTFMNVIEPAYDRYLSILKLTTVLPGSPTDFAGDRTGLTGAEEKAKNYHQQNRNVIPWEWLNDSPDNLYSNINKMYKLSTEISNLRKKPELSALNNGATVTLPVMKEVVSKKDGTKSLEKNENMQGILRYNDEGSVVIALNDTKGASAPLTKMMDRTNGPTAARIYLNPSITNAKQGLKHGIKVGTVFKNIRPEDKSEYVVSKSAEGYYLARRNANGQEIAIQIKPEDLNTLILYKAN